MSYGPHVVDASAPAWAYETHSEGAQGVQLLPARYAQDAAYRTPSGEPDFLASFQAAAFGLRRSLYRAGRSHPQLRARLRARLDHLVELERLRLTEKLLQPAAAGRAVTALVAQQLALLCPAQRVGICLCLSCGGAVRQVCPSSGEHAVPYHRQEDRVCVSCARVISGAAFIHHCLRCSRLRCDACLLDSYHSEPVIADLEVLLGVADSGAAPASAPESASSSAAGTAPPPSAGQGVGAPPQPPPSASPGAPQLWPWFVYGKTCASAMSAARSRRSCIRARPLYRNSGCACSHMLAGHRALRADPASSMGDGPRPQALPLSARSPVELVANEALGAEERLRRSQALLAFRAWLVARSAVSDQPLAFDAWLEASDARSIAKSLARYGQYLYDSGAPLYKLRQAILAVQGLRRDLRGSLTTAWDSVRVWEGLIPLHNHCPWPLPLWRAVLSLALLWGWWDVAFVLLLCFLALLRPAEALSLSVQDVLPPSLHGHPLLLVRINSPKNRRRFARREHVRISEPLAVAFAEALLARYANNSCRLYSGTATQFNGCVRMLVAKFGVAYSDATGVTLAGLRSGGATFLYLSGVSLEEVRWTGRWQAARTLEFYIQECAALSLLGQLSPASRQLVHLFAAITPSLIRRSAECYL